jgi:hypothetical protein
MHCCSLTTGLQLITTVNAMTISAALVAAKDGLRMAAEIRRCFVWIYLFSIPFYAVLALHSSGVLPELNSSINLLLVPQCLFLLLETFVVSRRVWAPRARRRVYNNNGDEGGFLNDDETGRYACR